jgi:ankyrin repeat protein
MTKVGNGRTIYFDKKNFKAYNAPIASVSGYKGKGFSGLWVAVQENKPDVVKILLQQKFDLTEQHADVHLLYLLAGADSCKSMVRLFAQNGVNFDEYNDEGWYPIILIVAEEGKWDCVYALIESGANSKATRRQGYGLLAEAAIQNNGMDIDYLISKMDGFDPMSYDSNLAMIFAAQNGNSNLVRNFLERGFDKCHSHKGKFLRDFALSKNHPETAALLPTKEQCISDYPELK